jgi:hypothetical protein
MPKMQLEKLADELIEALCFDIPGIVRLLHERAEKESRLQLVIARLRLPPLAKSKYRGAH